ncbi:MAG: hypothetical protein ACJ75J_07190, partial [Cytophagaceae bacterium]
MKALTAFFSILITFASCGQSTIQDSTPSQKDLNEYQVKTFTYPSLSIPAFVKSLLKNHVKDYAVLNSISFRDFSKTHDLNPLDSGNIEKFYSISILHDLFTSQTASNCSKGEILNIPYQWHWVNPNPRYSIRLTENGKLLKETKPSADFARYGSYADIDRTPYLFLSDLFTENPKYYSPDCDTFSTFGWCSEREMAFVSLLELLNFNGKVVADGNHSWSEFLVPMKTQDGKMKKFRIQTDNTFNGLNWLELEEPEETWKKSTGDSPMTGWYNQK